jgi:hypothetical protein
LRGLNGSGRLGGRSLAGFGVAGAAGFPGNRLSTDFAPDLGGFVAAGVPPHAWMLMTGFFTVCRERSHSFEMFRSNLKKVSILIFSKSSICIRLIVFH